MVKEKVTVIYERLSHLGLVAILICSTPAMAAQPSPSLAEMLDAAVARNPGVELADAERNVGQALQRKAAQPLSGDPTFNIKYQTDAVGSGSGYREWESGVELPLWLPGHAGSYAREGEQALSASDALLSAKRLDIAGEVRERLWSALIARGEAAQSQAAVEAANELFVDVQRRVEAGELPAQTGCWPRRRCSNTRSPPSRPRRAPARPPCCSTAIPASIFPSGPIRNNRCWKIRSARITPPCGCPKHASNKRVHDATVSAASAAPDRASGWVERARRPWPAATTTRRSVSRSACRLAPAATRPPPWPRPRLH